MNITDEMAEFTWDFVRSDFLYSRMIATSFCGRVFVKVSDGFAFLISKVGFKKIKDIQSSLKNL